MIDEKTITLTVAEFRKNVKAALDYALEGGVVIIDRMGQTFMLNHVPRNISVEFGSTPKGDNPFPKIISDGKPSIDMIEAMPHYKTDPVPDPDSGELSCCTRTKPCQHWFFNPDTSVWKNSLSGRQREVEL